MIVGDFSGMKVQDVKKNVQQKLLDEVGAKYCLSIQLSMQKM